MIYTRQQFDSLRSWSRLATAYARMSLAAGEVIVRRSVMMAQGTMSGPDAVGMVMEKATAFAQSAERVAVTAARGGDAARIAAAALKPYGAKARANARRLRR